VVEDLMESDAIGRTIMVGGMLRCCVATIQADPGPNTENKVLDCRNKKTEGARKCGARMIFKGGKWYWYPR
jgi:hypothetical protein